MEGKAHEDFRRAWNRTIGFGIPSDLIAMINAFDPREIIVPGIVETDVDGLESSLKIDVRQQLENRPDGLVEPAIWDDGF